MKKKIIPVLIVLIAVGAWAVLHLNKNGNDTGLKVSGNIEVTDTVLSFRIPGRVTERLVSEGDTLTKGQMVAQLDTTELEQQASLREAEVEVAQAALSELENGFRIEDVRAAGQRVKAAKADNERAKQNFERGKKLLARDVISQQEFEQLEAANRVSEARLKEAQEQLKRFKSGPRKEQIEQASARVKQAKDGLKLARTQLTYARLISPIAGVVLSDSVESGEYVNPGTPVVTVGDLKQVWLRAYVSETDLGRIKLGQKVAIKTDAFADKTFNGKITFISSEAEFTPRMVQTHKERVKLVYRIKVTVDNPDQLLKPGMPADGQIVL